MAQDEKPLSWNNRMSGIDPITSISNTVGKALDLANKKALTPEQEQEQAIRNEHENNCRIINTNHDAANKRMSDTKNPNPEQHKPTEPSGDSGGRQG